MALDNTKKTTSMQPRNVNKAVLNKLRELNGGKARNNSELVTWWLNEMTPKLIEYAK
jgi:hypothetical protein